MLENELKPPYRIRHKHNRAQHDIADTHREKNPFVLFEVLRALLDDEVEQAEVEEQCQPANHRVEAVVKRSDVEF